MTDKRCPACDTVKPLDEFYSRGRLCKICRRKKGREAWKKYSAIIKTNRAKIRQRHEARKTSRQLMLMPIIDERLQEIRKLRDKGQYRRALQFAEHVRLKSGDDSIPELNLSILELKQLIMEHVTDINEPLITGLADK